MDLSRYLIYRPIHFLGIFLIMMAIGAICLHVMNGGTKEDNPKRKFLAIVHGIGLLLAMTGGMGLMKAQNLSHAVGTSLPHWIIVKLAIWTIFGMASFLIYKLPKLAPAFFFLFCFLGVSAGFLANMFIRTFLIGF